MPTANSVAYHGMFRPRRCRADLVGRADHDMYLDEPRGKVVSFVGNKKLSVRFCAGGVLELKGPLDKGS